ncbi:RNA-directed DNA polymerase, eukaryota, partial [Tanacetum coccineum]
SLGEYSVSSARSYIDDLLLPTVDKLPTRLNLSLRGIDIPSIICPICSLAGESCSHILFSCSMARLLWRKAARWWDFNIPEFLSYEDWIAWFDSIRISKVFKDVLEGFFYVMCYRDYCVGMPWSSGFLAWLVLPSSIFIFIVKSLQFEHSAFPRLSAASEGPEEELAPEEEIEGVEGLGKEFAFPKVISSSI